MYSNKPIFQSAIMPASFINQFRAKPRADRSTLSLLLLLLLFFGFICQTPAYGQTQVYRLGPGDMIGISIFQEDNMNLQVRLGDPGIINFPFIGEVEVTDKSTSEVETMIEQLLIDGEFFVNPEVTVNILAYRSFYIDGEVASPGSYPYEPGLTLRRAVSIAGGFTERANRSNISIISDIESPGSEVAPNILDRPVYPDDVITVGARFF